MREVETGVTAVLQAVSPVDDRTVWVSGHEGLVLRSRDGGASWRPVPAPAGDSLQFRDIHGFDDASAVVLSSGSGPLSRIYRTDDGGESWTLGYLMEDSRGFLDCLDFWDGRRGFAYGDAIDGRLFILVTEDGGRTWTRPDPSGVPSAGEGEGGFAASGTCARAGMGGEGWIGTGAGGAGRVVATSDYGRSWASQAVPITKGEVAGIFTVAMAGPVPAMVLGGDLSDAESVVPNAAVPGSDGEPWAATATPAPVPGAVYGSASATRGETTLIFAFAPTASAYTENRGETWTPLPGVAAWAGAFGPSGTVGWAAGVGGRIWTLRVSSGSP